MDQWFCTFAKDEESGDFEADRLEGSGRVGRRRLFRLRCSGVQHQQVMTYAADGFEFGTGDTRFTQCFPWSSYGAILEWTAADSLGLDVDFAVRGACRISITRRPEQGAFGILVTGAEDSYRVALEVVGFDEPVVDGSALSLRAAGPELCRIGVAFGIDDAGVQSTARSLASAPEGARVASRDAWNRYLESCPLVAVDDEISCTRADGVSRSVSAEDLLRRQLWHWWVALVNVSDVEFNAMNPCVSPDKGTWFGTWSNDGPETMCALALTNQRDLARRALVEYVRISIDEVGDLGWYTHAYGRSCLSHPGDSGFFSHGVSAIVHAVGFYVRSTGDSSILDMPAGDGQTVWQKLDRYLDRLLLVRDSNDDGLPEMNNIWEGWDDKVIPFFANASLEQWIAVVSRNDPAEVADFYRANSNPVTTIYEQIFYLSALESMEHLALGRGDRDRAAALKGRFEAARTTIEERHWDPLLRCYRDWDTKGLRLVDSFNLDAFYYLGFTSSADRVADMVDHLRDPATFGLAQLPSLSADHPEFDPTGYWRGGHWPREMLYVSLALNDAGHSAVALAYVIEALLAAEGCVVPENINPRTEKLNTRVYAMAYSSCLNLALLEIVGGGSQWRPSRSRAVIDEPTGGGTMRVAR